MVDLVIRKSHVLYEDGPDLGELLETTTGKNKGIGTTDHQEDLETGKELEPEPRSEEDEVEITKGATKPGRIFRRGLWDYSRT